MINKIIYLLIILAINIFCFNLFIKLLKKKQIGQSIRAAGPKNHLIKSGTPTMGGIIIIINSIISYLLFIYIFKIDFNYLNFLILIIPFIGYGIIGFIDDYLIIKKHNNEGLKPSIKFIFELILATVFYFIYLELGFNNKLNFFGIYIDLGFLYGVFIVLFFTGFTNATNFTDGVDGLLSFNAIASFICIAVLSLIKNEKEAFWLSIIIIWVLISFLVFNLSKASLFMGDTGSLSIGALICSILIYLKCEILIIFFGFIYLVEIISVILQVWYFKRTKGKRIFKMTPIHHHFELKGLNENQIDLLFSVCNLLMSVIGLYLGVKIF